MIKVDKHCRMTIIIYAGVLLAFLSGCGGGNGNGSSGSSSSNLAGKAIHEVDGGACCHPPVDTPLASVLITFHSPTSSAAIRQVTTDASGNYSVKLPPGTYVVDLGDRSAGLSYNTVTPAQISIPASGTQQINLIFVEDVP